MKGSHLQITSFIIAVGVVAKFTVGTTVMIVNTISLSHNVILIVEAKHITPEVASELARSTLGTNAKWEANVWHLYRQNKLDTMEFLPPSMHPGMLQNKRFQKIHANHPEIPLIGKTELKGLLQNVIEIFKALGLLYSNRLRAHELLGAPKNGHDTSNVFTLNAKQRKMMTYVNNRADNYSTIKLVNCATHEKLFSVMTKSFCPEGTIVLEYTGVLIAGAQKTAIADAKSSMTWTLLEHRDESRSIYVDPSNLCNLARFINGLRCEEQRMANIAAVKCRDHQGFIRIMFVALHDIPANTHLLYYYGDSYPTDWYDDDSDVPIACSGHNEEDRLRELTGFYSMNYLTVELKWNDVDVETATKLSSSRNTLTSAIKESIDTMSSDAASL